MAHFNKKIKNQCSIRINYAPCAIAAYLDSSPLLFRRFQENLALFFQNIV